MPGSQRDSGGISLLFSPSLIFPPPLVFFPLTKGVVGAVFPDQSLLLVWISGEDSILLLK